jgi:SAM-dependent methyltransferase
MSETRKGLLKSIAEALFGAEARIAAAWSAAAHRRLFKAQWLLKPEPEWFDHRLDLHWQWLADRNPLWVERGVFGALALQGGSVLELACGDGFNARNFYSLRSRRVVACDFDETALAAARRHNAAPNVEFVLADIRTAMPEGTFENIVWDAAIEHFTPDEIASIMAQIKRRLSPDGVLSGYTVVEREDGAKHLSTHEYEFRDMQDLHRFLAPHFRHVKVFETVYPARHNLYFWASDGTIPFAPEWAPQYPRAAAPA